MKKIIHVVCFLLIATVAFSQDVVEPDDPDNPSVKGDTGSKDTTRIELVYQKQSGTFGKGVIEPLFGEYLSGLVWDGNTEGSQEILTANLASIRITGYTKVKKTKNNLGLVFYFPYQYTIKLKDGTELTNVKGRIKQLESFVIYNSIGREKAYTYFGRYWLEDKQMFYDNNSPDFDERAPVPEEVIIFLEFK